MRPTLQIFFVWVGKKTVEKLEKYSISGFLQILQPVLDFCGFNHFLDFGMVFFSTKAKKKTRSNHCTVPLVWLDCKNYIYGRILKPRTQNWGKNDKMMPKSCPVKARLTKHNLKSKF